MRRLLTLIISLGPSTVYFGIQIMMPQYSTMATDLTISAVGDWGCNSNTGKTVSNIKNKDPDLVLALGDYSYQSM